MPSEPSAPPTSSDRDNSLRVEETARCDRCGRFGALSVSGRLLCLDCHETAGSCCAEFDADDS